MCFWKDSVLLESVILPVPSSHTYNEFLLNIRLMVLTHARFITTVGGNLELNNFPGGVVETPVYNIWSLTSKKAHFT